MYEVLRVECPIKKAANQHRYFVRLVVESKVTGIENMDVRMRQVSPICLRLGNLERGIVPPPRRAIPERFQ
jgi:hypothetical protein